jgi:hypothetical protein
MTETAASKGPVRLLHECARLAGFDPATGWPDELPFKGVVNILAGEWKLSDAGRKEWARMLSAAIKPGGGLTTIEKVTTVQPLPRGIGRRLSQNSTWNHWAHGREPEMLYTPAPETRVSYYITRAALAAWLRAIGETAETLNPCALLWLGDEWQPVQAPETGKPGGERKRSEGAAAVASRPEERQAFMRAIWLEFDKPKNQTVWNEMKKQAGRDKSPIIAVIGNDEFTFLYDDGGTEPLSKKTFQNDMTEVRR